MIRTVRTTIVSPASVPREGLPVPFYPVGGGEPVIGMTDASGDMRADLDTAVTYRVPVENAVTVDGLSFPAGTVFVVQAPEGEGVATAIESLVGTLDGSRIALLDRLDEQAQLIAEQGQMILGLDQRVRDLEMGGA